MKRVIITPAVLPPAALGELKQWLAITTTMDDGPLAELLQVALEICADFTGIIPLQCTCEEIVAPHRPRHLGADGGYISHWRLDAPWHKHGNRLSSRPVRAITDVFGISADGTRTELGIAAVGAHVDADGGCSLRLPEPIQFHRYAIRFSAGLADDWEQLPPPLRHGIIRLAAHQHRTRENPGAAPLPPASVTALWLPWRQMRIA